MGSDAGGCADSAVNSLVERFSSLEACLENSRSNHIADTASSLAENTLLDILAQIEAFGAWVISYD